MENLEQIISKGPFVMYKFKVDPSYKIESITDNCQRIIGYTDTELLESNPSFHEIIHSEDRQIYLNELKEFINIPGNHYHKPYRITTKDGQIIWVNDYKLVENSNVGEANAVTGYLTVLPNYDELNKSEKLFRLLAEHSTDLISRHTAEAIFLYASPACKEMLGYEANELIGHSSFEFIHPDDLRKVENSKTSIINDRITSTIEYRFRCKNGQYIWLETISQTIVDKNSGDILEIHASSRNINDKKLAQISFIESKANIQAIIENTTDSIWAINLNYEIIYINEVFKNAFKNSFGVTLSIGMNLLQAIPQNIREIWKSRYDKAFKNEQFVFEEKIDLTGFSIYIEVAMNPIVSNGQVIGASFFSRDITERRQMEQKLVNSEQKLTALFDTMTEMVVMHLGDFGLLI